MDKFPRAFFQPPKFEFKNHPERDSENKPEMTEVNGTFALRAPSSQAPSPLPPPSFNPEIPLDGLGSSLAHLIPSGSRPGPGPLLPPNSVIMVSRPSNISTKKVAKGNNGMKS